MARPIYATLDDLRLRVREEVLVQCLDFNRDGAVDDPIFLGAVAEPACADLDRWVSAFTKGQVPFAAAPASPESIKLLALDLYQHRLGTMFPTYAHVDVPALWAKIQADLKRLREATNAFGDVPPDPAYNTGGSVGAIGDAPAAIPPEGMFDNMGDFSPS